MLRPPRITDHAVDRTGLLDDLVHGRRDGGFLGHVGLEREELVGIPVGDGREVVPRRADVDGVDAGGAVGKTAVCDAEADSWRGGGGILGMGLGLGLWKGRGGGRGGEGEKVGWCVQCLVNFF